MFHVFGGNGAVFGGNGPPTKSECGHEWDAYMSECCEEEFRTTRSILLREQCTYGQDGSSSCSSQPAASGFVRTWSA